MIVTLNDSLSFKNLGFLQLIFFQYMKKFNNLIFISALALGLSMISCKKVEGPGGTSTITGKVFIRQYNANFTVLTDQYYAADEDVFIIYGDDPAYGDKTTTNFDGTYQFEYLREGKYTVFAYSEDSINYPTKHKIPVLKTVEITKRNQEVSVGTLVILK